MEMKNEIDSNLAPMGHIYASGRAGRLNSRAKRTEETWNGLSQVEFVHRLAEMNTTAVAGKLEELRRKIIGSGLIVNVTGLSLDSAGAEIAKRFSRFGAPASRLAANYTNETPPGKKIEIFSSKSLQVGFAAVSMNAAPFDTKEQLAETVLAHQLSTGALWENIRMKGGAYGAFINSDALEDCVSFATYRDPTPARSLDTFSAILKNSAYAQCDEDYLVKSIIGCYAKETRPRTSAENGHIDFFRFLYGVEDSYRKRKLERLVSVSTADITAAFTSLGSRSATGTVVIAGEKEAEKIAKALGAEVTPLL
jgi:Zn-dependent M16 (insulinase) family peptidase